jgi:hypothetical protein
MGLACHQPGVQVEAKNDDHLNQVAIIDYIFLPQKTLTILSTISKKRIITLPVRIPHSILLYISPAIGPLEFSDFIQ